MAKQDDTSKPTRRRRNKPEPGSTPPATDEPFAHLHERTQGRAEQPTAFASLFVIPNIDTCYRAFARGIPRALTRGNGTKKDSKARDACDLLLYTAAPPATTIEPCPNPSTPPPPETSPKFSSGPQQIPIERQFNARRRPTVQSHRRTPDQAN